MKCSLRATRALNDLSLRDSMGCSSKSILDIPNAFGSDHLFG
jgi:hypothetical protein